MNLNALQGAIALHNKTAKAFAKANNGQKIQMAGETMRLNHKLLKALAEVIETMQRIRVPNMETMQLLCINSAAAVGFARKTKQGIDGGFLKPDFELVTPPDWEKFKVECDTVLKFAENLQKMRDDPLIQWLEEQLTECIEDSIEGKVSLRGRKETLEEVLVFIRGEADA